MSSIHFYKEEVSFRLNKQKELKNWIIQTVLKEGFELNSLNFIFCNDDYLHKMNVKYLKHNTLTDVITFNYNENKLVSGDIFISIDRIKENAAKENVNFTNELSRVMIHGVLHLLGYNDKTKKDKNEMTNKEDYYLNCKLQILD